MYLLPALAMLLALVGAPTLPASGAASTASIRAESWEHTDADRARSGTMVEQYGQGHRTRTYDSPRHSAQFSFNAIASKWDVGLLSENSRVELWLRTSADGTAWSEWKPVGVDDDGGVQAGTNFGNLLVSGGSWMQYRLRLAAPSDESLPRLRSLTFTLIDSQREPEAEREARAGVAYAVEAPPVISRAQWGADERLRYDSSGRETWPVRYVKPRKAIIHETVTINNDPNPPATVRAIYYYHAIVRGWGDIGYNYLVDTQGRIYEGRTGGRNVVGGHARCFNPGTIGIAALGDYSKVRPTRALVSSIERILAWEFEANGIDPLGHGVLGDYAPRDIPNIAGHVDLDGVCGNTHQDPGIYLRGLFPEIRRNVAYRIGAGSEPTPVPPAPTPSPPPGQAEPQYIVVGTNGEGLNLRDKPGMSGRTLARVPDGTLIQEETSKIDGWVKTTYKGMTGYLWHRFLKEQSRPDAPPVTPPPPSDGGPLQPGSTAIISGTPGALSLREGPGTQYKVVIKMWEGWDARIEGTPRGGWYPVRYRDGAGTEYSGWAWGQFLKPGKSRTASAVGAVALAGAMGLPVWGVRRRRRRRTVLITEAPDSR